MKTSGDPERSRPVFSLVFLLLIAAANIFLSLYIVPKFEQIFQDALGPDHPLPPITNLIIGARMPLVIFALIWSIAASIVCWQRGRFAIWIIILGILFFLVVIGISIIALFMPISGNLITGMPDPSLSSSESSH